jgi:membrane-associated phospholipid phosphatase
MAGNAYTAAAVPRERSTRLPGAGGAAAPLLAAVACGLTLAAVWLLSTRIPAARVRDALVLGDFIGLNTPSVEAVGNFLLHLLEPLLFIIWAAVIVCVALARSRPRLAFATAVVMALAPLTSETLKPILAHPHISTGEVQINPASWPSGHSTAALVLVLCAVLVAPARWRPLVAGVGAVYVAAVALALLVLAWHMPSDVLGGFLVASLWACLAVAWLRVSERRSGDPALA